MSNSECPECVELKIPCKPEYVGVARLALLGVASRMQFSYDEVEDVRLAVGEACTTSVQWAERNGSKEAVIVLRSQIGQEKLVVDIYDTAGNRGDQPGTKAEQEPEDLLEVLITLLVDEVAVEPGDDGTHLRMVKYARQR